MPAEVSNGPNTPQLSQDESQLVGSTAQLESQLESQNRLFGT